MATPDRTFADDTRQQPQRTIVRLRNPQGLGSRHPRWVVAQCYQDGVLENNRWLGNLPGEHAAQELFLE